MGKMWGWGCEDRGICGACYYDFHFKPEAVIRKAMYLGIASGFQPTLRKVNTHLYLCKVCL